jgi:hypothetical protein
MAKYSAAGEAIVVFILQSITFALGVVLVVVGKRVEDNLACTLHHLGAYSITLGALLIADSIIACCISALTCCCQKPKDEDQEKSYSGLDIHKILKFVIFGVLCWGMDLLLHASAGDCQAVYFTFIRITTLVLFFIPLALLCVYILGSLCFYTCIGRLGVKNLLPK